MGHSQLIATVSNNLLRKTKALILYWQWGPPTYRPQIFILPNSLLELYVKAGDPLIPEFVEHFTLTRFSVTLDIIPSALTLPWKSLNVLQSLLLLDRSLEL